MAEIRNPIQWTADAVERTASVVQSALHGDVDINLSQPEVRSITLADLKDVLIEGWQDFLAERTDVIFLCLIYPLAGLVIAQETMNLDLLPLLFPFVAGFAIIGPFAATWLYEMSRLRAQGDRASWLDAFRVFKSHSIDKLHQR